MAGLSERKRNDDQATHLNAAIRIVSDNGQEVKRLLERNETMDKKRVRLLEGILKNFTNEEIQEAIGKSSIGPREEIAFELKEQGYTFKQIGEMLNPPVTGTTASNMFDRACERKGIGPETFKRNQENQKARKSKQRTAQCLLLRSQGYTLREIGKLLDPPITGNHVRLRIDAYGRKIRIDLSPPLSRKGPEYQEHLKELGAAYERIMSEMKTEFPVIKYTE